MGTPITVNTPSVVLSGAPIGNQPRLIAGTIISAGQPIRLNAADNRAYPAVATQGGDPPTATMANVYGIALANVWTGQPFTAAVDGVLTINDTPVLLPGQIICCNAGGLITYEELVPGDYVTILGIATTTTRIQLHIWPTGYTVPEPPTP